MREIVVSAIPLKSKKIRLIVIVQEEFETVTPNFPLKDLPRITTLLVFPWRVKHVMICLSVNTGERPGNGLVWKPLHPGSISEHQGHPRKVARGGPAAWTRGRKRSSLGGTGETQQLQAQLEQLRGRTREAEPGIDQDAKQSQSPHFCRTRAKIFKHCLTPSRSAPAELCPHTCGSTAPEESFLLQSHR